jgi:hypothetical protein
MAAVAQAVVLGMLVMLAGTLARNILLRGQFPLGRQRAVGGAPVDSNPTWK